MLLPNRSEGMLETGTLNSESLFSSTISLVNSCIQYIECQFFHANALYDSKFHRRKIIKNLRRLLRKLLEITGFEDYFLYKLLIREMLSVIFKNSGAEAKIQILCYLLQCYGRLKYGKNYLKKID